MAQYHVVLILTRELTDDADVIGNPAATEFDFREQVRKELQQAYDENIIGGSFVIAGVVGVLK